MKKTLLFIALFTFCFQMLAQQKYASIEDIPTPLHQSSVVHSPLKAGVNDYISLEPQERYMTEEWGDTLINFSPEGLFYLGDVNGDGYDDFYFDAGYVGGNDKNDLDKGTFKTLIVYGGSDLNNLTKEIIRRKIQPAGDINGDGYDDAIGTINHIMQTGKIKETYYFGSATGLVKHSEEIEGIITPEFLGYDMDGDGFEDLVRTGSIVFTANNVNDYQKIPIDNTSIMTVGNVDDTYPRLFYMVNGGSHFKIKYFKFDNFRNIEIEDTINVTEINNYIHSLEFADINGDGLKEILFHTDSTYYLPKAASDSLYSNKPVALSIFNLKPVGDYNKDGNDDLVYCDSTGKWNIIYGNNDISLVGNTISPFDISKPNSTKFTTGDINGDNYNDIIFNYSDNSNIGQRIAVGGSSISYSNIFYPKNKYQGNNFVQTVNIGDINVDGFDDVAFHSNKVGQNSYIYTNTNSEPFIILNPGLDKYFNNIIGENINDDNMSDLIILERDYHYIDSTKIHIYYGGDKASSIPDYTISINNFQQENEKGSEQSIHSIGDINHDGINDFAISIKNYYIFYGGKPTYTTPDITIEYDKFFIRKTLKLGDINDDETDDFAIVCNDIVDVYYGQGNGATSNDYKPSKKLVPDYDFFVSYIISCSSGDFNGDGYKDIAFMPLDFLDFYNPEQEKPGLHIFHMGPGQDTIPDKLLHIPIKPLGSDSSFYAKTFYGDFKTIPDINGDQCDEIFLAPKNSTYKSINSINYYGHNGNIFLGGNYLVQDSIPAYQLKGYKYMTSFGAENKYFSYYYSSAYGDFNSDGIKELLVVDRNKNFRGVPVSRFNLGNNHSPTDIILSNTSMQGIVSKDTEIGTFTATDEDTENTHTFSLVACNNNADADNAKFTISGNKLLAATELNPETQTEYKINVRAKDNFGEYTDKNFVITLQSTSNIEENKKLNVVIYPNPVQNTLSIKTGNNQLKHITVFDLSGRICYKETTKAQEFKVNVSAFPQGIYNIKLESGNQIYNQKIIKQ